MRRSTRSNSSPYRTYLLAGILAAALMTSPIGMPSGIAEQTAQATPVGQIVKLRGAAEITRGRVSLPLVLGAAVQPGDVVKTGPGGRLKLHFIDGSTVALGESAELEIGGYTVSADPASRDALLELGQGTLHALAAKAGPGSRFEIRTALAYSAVRGTEWFVDAAPTETDVAVVTGRVGVGLAKISAESAVSIGRNAKIAVSTPGGQDDAQLGQPRLLTESEIAALLAKTEMPGEELDFNLTAAPALDFPTPTSAPDGAAPGSPAPGQKRDCLTSNMEGCGRGGDKDGGNNGGRGGNSDHNKDHESGGGSGT